MSAFPVSLLLDVLGQQRFGVEYQPLINPHSGEIAAYEALARFYDAQGQILRTDQVFHALHDSPLTMFQAEYQMKQLQLDYAPPLPLFVNLDPDVYQVADEGEQMHPLLQLLSRRGDVVLEIIENSDISAAGRSIKMADDFARQGIPLALDDIGAPQSMLSLPLLIKVDCLKFDRSWLSLLHCPFHRAAISSLIAYAQATGKQTVLEGIETEAQREMACTLGVDLVQGFLYRPGFIHIQP
ncbi:EAL domain-containing protein [Chitinibacter tainanensis]|uniref:EAL domain-containing protein n=1 Tax=Chitinibacter tainanensis TaxID=230667 RepID=UPI00042A8DC2|nr:EAL domain-containing protein [Chitinibacter tainanensis]